MNGLYRRAVEVLESARGSKLAPGWNQAWLGVPQPLYRPDIKGPAYYEFPVDLPLTPGATVSHTGFIILSTGPHDFPIAHWNYTGKSPTQVMRDAAMTDTLPLTFFKLDALAYAAEDSAGKLVATLGTPLAKVGGMDPSWLTKTPPISTFIYTPTLKNPDSQQGVGGGISSTVGPLSSSLTLDGWHSWQELKAGFNASYGILISGLTRQAAVDWDTESLLNQYGEGLRKGQTYNLPALDTLMDHSASGSGTQFVTLSELKRIGLPSILQIHVNGSVLGQEFPLSVTLYYSGGVSETVRFTVVDPPPVLHTYLPVMANNSASTTSALSDMSVSGAGADVGMSTSMPRQPADTWGPWNYYWAGSDADQRLYTQIDQSENPPNNTGCPSGCGATAWAMLFGWADNQAASGNPYWAPRWGLYRFNGGYGADAVAPSIRDTGVTNMTWEIRARIGTWCVFGSAPTLPWNMGNAAGYFAGRTGTSMVTHWDSFGIHEDGLRDAAANSIIYRHTPAVIGTGWLNHYPLAYGYAWQLHTVRHCFIWCWTDTDYNRAFYVNQGWGGAGNGWISAGTWFDGEIYP
jgi:hypothetical protein